MPRKLLIPLVVILAISSGASAQPYGPEGRSILQFPSLSIAPGADTSPADAPWAYIAATSDPAQEVIELINQFRVEEGLRPLIVDPRLNSAAQRHSDDMATHDFFGHMGTDGSDPWRRMVEAGYPLDWGAECIAAGQQDARAAVDAWLGSQEHREVLLGDFVHVGAALAVNSNSTYGYYWTVDLAVPIPATGVPTATASWTPTPVATSTAGATATPSWSPTVAATETRTATPRPPTPTATLIVQVKPSHTPTWTPRPPTPTPTPVAYPGPRTPRPTSTATPIGWISPTPPVLGEDAHKLYFPLLVERYRSASASRSRTSSFRQ